jgi:putative transposase
MRKRLVDKNYKVLSLRRQSDLLTISRGSIYYEPKGEKEENLKMMQLMDAHFLEEPTAGVLTMQSYLENKGYKAGYERVRRLMRKAAIMPIYPQRHLTVLGQKKYVYPYLLKSISIQRPNQVWAIDITYLPMQKGFMYMTAIIDVYSRYIVGWGISNSLDARASLEVIKQAIKIYGKPEIINSDQGSQFTCIDYIEYLKKQGIQVSMDGKGRALDNVYIERFWRTLKYQHIYLRPAEHGIELYQGLKQWIKKYNHKPHQGIGRMQPIIKYKSAA